MTQFDRMPLVEALRVLHDARGEEIVVTTMGVTREWLKISENPLDMNYIPSAMGHGTGIGLGLALAQPGRHVVVLNGDGSMLMNLSSIVSIVDARASNLTLVVMNNGVYEVTGGQQLPSGETVDYPAMAAAAGFPTTVRFSDMEAWREQRADVFAMPGPRLIELRVAPMLGEPPPVFRHSMPQRIARLQQALGVG